MSGGAGYSLLVDALLLLAVVAQARTLLGARVGPVEARGPYALWLPLRVPAPRSLLVAADEALPRFSLDTPPPPGGAATPFVQAARDLVSGSRLDAIEHAGLDRFLLLRFIASSGEAVSLAAELFGRRPNLVFLDREGKTLATLRPSADPYTRPPAPGRPDPALVDVGALAAALQPALAGGRDAVASLRESLSGLSPLWAEEVVARASDRSAVGLAASLRGLLDRVVGNPPDPRLVLDGDAQPIEVVPVPLAHLPAARQAPLDSIAAGLETLARHLGRARQIGERREHLVRALTRAEARLASRLRHLQQDAEEAARAELYQRMGELLIQHQALVPRGRPEVVLPDPAADPPGAVAIPLDGMQSALANAQRLFKQAKRGRRGALRVAARTADTERDLGEIRALRGRLTAATTRPELDAIRRELEQTRSLSPRDRAALAGAQPERPAPRSRPAGREARVPAELEPRRFISSEGLPILVGRGPEGNDRLTLHLARSNDLWLHVQGRSGSHVVVRSGNRAGGVPRRTLVEAAQLAAYYSQAREDGKVAVDYTLRKFVRKPRKGKPGLVTISQEKTLVVSPDKTLVARLAAR